MKKPIRIQQLNTSAANPEGNPEMFPFAKEETRLWGLLKVHRTWYCLTADYARRIYFDDGSELEIVIPAGYSWNGASIPFAARWLIPASRLLIPSTGHDFGYGSASLARKMLDMIFRLGCLQIAKAHPIRAFLAYWAVRIFGKSNYNWRRAVA